MAYTPSRVVLPLVQELRDSVVRELQARGLADGLCFTSILPGGQVPIDYAAEACTGFMWVQLINANPTQRFPSPVSEPNACVSTLALTVQVGLMRPALLPEEFQGEITLPTGDEQEEEAEKQFADMEAMLAGIMGADIDQILVTQYEPAGPDGGAVGGTWTVQIGSDD